MGICLNFKVHEIEWLMISSLSLREGTVEIGIRKINGGFFTG